MFALRERAQIPKKYLTQPNLNVFFLKTQKSDTYKVQDVSLIKYRINIRRGPIQDCTICPGSTDPFDLVSYYIKCVTTSWTHSI